MDDSKAMRMVVRRTLEEAGYGDPPTAEAADGKLGLAAANGGAAFLIGKPFTRESFQEELGKALAA